MLADGRWIVTAVTKTVETEWAGSIFPAADIFAYYEANASLLLMDREFIIAKGFQEWLLAAIMSSSVETAANSTDAFTQYPIRHETDIVTLIANLVGGGTDDANFYN